MHLFLSALNSVVGGRPCRLVVYFWFMPLDFIPFSQENRQQVLGLMAAFYAHFDYSFLASGMEALMQTFLDNPALGRGWLIRSEGQDCGYLVLTYRFSFEHGGRDAFIDELYLEPTFRGQGLGRQAIDFAVQQACAVGVQVLLLEVEQHNPEAKRLYLSQRFADSGRSLLMRAL